MGTRSTPRHRDSHERAFFIYDHQKHGEEADPKDAILYFYPPSVDVVEQIALVGGIIGTVDFCIEVLGYTPSVVSLTTCRFALLKTGPFILGLSSELQVPQEHVVEHLQFLWKTFCMFQGNLLAVKQRTGKDGFTLELEAIWTAYFTLCQSFCDSLSQAFGIIPYLELPVSQSSVFLQASHILQTAQHQTGVVGGVLLNRNRVLCTQLGPDITRRLLVLMPFKQNFPCIEIKPAFDLPGGVRLLCTFLTPSELSSLGPRKRAKSQCNNPPHDQDRKDNSTASFTPSTSAVSTSHSKVTTSPVTDTVDYNPTPHQPPPLSTKSPHGFHALRESVEKMLEDVEEEEDEDWSLADINQSESVLSGLSVPQPDELMPGRCSNGDRGVSVRESQRVARDGSVSSSCDDTENVNDNSSETVVCNSQTVIANSQAIIADSLTEQTEVEVAVEDKLIENSFEQQGKRTATVSETAGVNGSHQSWSIVDDGCGDGDVTINRSRNSGDEASSAEDGDADIQRVREPVQEVLNESDNREHLSAAESPELSLEDRADVNHPEKSDESHRDPDSQDRIQHEMPGHSEGDAANGNEDPDRTLAQNGQRSRVPEVDGGEEETLDAGLIHSANTGPHTQPTGMRDDDGNSHCVAPLEHSSSVTVEELNDVDHCTGDAKADRSSLLTPGSSSVAFSGSSASSAPTIPLTPPGTLPLGNTCSVDITSSEAQSTNLIAASCKGSSAAAHTNTTPSKHLHLDSSTASEDSPASPLQLSLMSPVTQVVHFETHPTVIGQKDGMGDSAAGPTSPGDMDLSLSNVVQRSRANSNLTMSDDVLSPSKEHLSFGNSQQNLESSGSGSAQTRHVLPVRLLSEYSTEPSSSDITRSVENISGMSSSSTLLSSPGDEEGGKGGHSGLEGRQKVLLYVQGHMDTLLVLLMDDLAYADRETINVLWKSSLAKLAELDFAVSDANGMTDDFRVGRSSYQYLKYDLGSHAMGGTATQAVTSMANELVTTSTLLHDSFRTMPSTSDILCRTHTACCYGHRNLSSETFFQVPVTNGGGYPDPRDPVFSLDQLADRKLYTNHCSTLL